MAIIKETLAPRTAPNLEMLVALLCLQQDKMDCTISKN